RPSRQPPHRAILQLVPHPLAPLPPHAARTPVHVWLLPIPILAPRPPLVSGHGWHRPRRHGANPPRHTPPMENHSLQIDLVWNHSLPLHFLNGHSGTSKTGVPGSEAGSPLDK